MFNERSDMRPAQREGRRTPLFERVLVGFARVSTAMGLFLAVAIGLPAIFVFNGGDALIALVGPQSTGWWIKVGVCWIIVSGIVGAFLWRRELSQISGAPEPRVQNGPRHE